MIGFNEELMMQKADMLYALVPLIENTADEICERGFDNILLTSSGGSLASLDQYAYMIKRMSDIPVICETAAELPLVGNSLITERTLAVMQSKSGDTGETLSAAKWLKERNVLTMSFCGKENSPLKELTEFSVTYGTADPHDILSVYLFGRILYKLGKFPEYPKFRDQMKNFGRIICDAHKKAEPMAAEFAEMFRNKDVPYQIWISSGNTWGFTYDMAMCVLEESLWLRTKSVTSPEFFHGTIELVEPGLPVIVGVGEGVTRPLDERVVRFCREHTDKLLVIDTKEYPMEGLDEQFRWLVSPLVLLMIYYRMSWHISEVLGHDMDIRRYYRRMEY